jgi:hypothetical protein
MTEDNLRLKIDRVEEIRRQLEEAESMNPAKAKELRDEGLRLLDQLEQELDVGDGTVEYQNQE